MKEDKNEEKTSVRVPHSLRNLGRSLTLLRDLRRVSLRSTARKAGIGQSQLSKYENAHGLPKMESLEKVLSALDMTFLDLFNTMALFDVFEEEMRSGERKESMVFNLLHTRGIIGDSVSLGIRRVVDDLILLHTEIMTAAVRPGIEEKGNERVGTGRISTGALRTPRGN